MQKLTYPFPFRLDETTAAELEALSGKTELHKAQIIRFALKRYLADCRSGRGDLLSFARLP